MLTMRHLIENLELAHKAIKQWPFKHIESLDFFRASATIIYKVKADHQDYYLRMIPVSERKKKLIDDELALIDYLKINKVNLVQALASKKGPKVLYIDDHYVALFKAVKGQRMDQLELHDEHVILMAKQLANIHALTSKRDDLVSRRIYDILADFETDLAWVGRERDDLINQLFKLDCSFGIIHFDYEPDNLFYDAKTQQMHVIDFESAIKSYHMHDIYTVFEAWEDSYYLPKDTFQFFKDLFLHTYQTIHPNFIYKEAHEALFKRVNRLVQYIHLSHCLSDIPDEDQAWMADMVFRFGVFINYYDQTMKDKWT